MRKIWSSLWLSLFLLIAQQGAVLHEISHLATSQPSAGQTGKAHVAGSACDDCLAFAQVASFVATSVPSLQLPPATHAWLASLSFRARDADVPAHSARDPPNLL
ncbi:MAG TPA: hypothetical protein VLA61_00920 [Ideonella sp.]|uniref:hypothetical protein n=1 Tax=Ideonella sp. TaxID=1929293 RepID=UPI002B9A5532|nr:hypothetical protein [Ideonella sp.]HSI46813.1 hypothetical protein [Ideonella sp.]